MGNHPEPPDLRVTAVAIAMAWPNWEPTGACAPWGFLVGVDGAGGLAPSALLAHPLAALGTLARGSGIPGAWRAAGIATTGVARPLDGNAPARPVAVVWVCARDGRSASWVRLPGEPPGMAFHDHGTSTGVGVPVAEILRALVAGA